MIRPNSFFASIAVVAFALVMTALAARATFAIENAPRISEQPNFLIFIADDCSYHDIGCYGNDQIKTPNIDGFAKQGMRFEYAFNSAPMCAPTRMSLYTGIHPVRNGAHPNHSRVYDRIKSFPHYLKPLGYDVALIGKQHYKPLKNFPFEFLGGRTHDDGEARDWEPEKLEDFLAQHQQSPFCLFVCSNQPHQPWNRGDRSQYKADELELPPYFVDTPETRNAMVAYYAEITYMDQQFGDCLDLLKRYELESNTVVVFLSEQGSNFPHCKWTCYDTGLRSAQVVRWPTQVKAGATSKALTQYVDWLPTCIELAGGELNETDLDGMSLVNVLNGTKETHRDAVFGIQTSRGINQGPEAYGIRTVRNERYRLVWNLNFESQFQNVVTEGFKTYQSWGTKGEAGDQFAKQQFERYQSRPEFELYDLDHDPFEMNNLAGTKELEDIQAMLQRKLTNWMEQQGDQGTATEMDALNRQSKQRQTRRKQ